MDNATSFNRKSGVQRFLSKLFTNRTKRQTRSKTGNAVVFFFIAILAVFSAVPLVLSIGMSFKPLNELYMFPPKLMCICQEKVDTEKHHSFRSPVRSCTELGFYSPRQLQDACY